MDNNGTTNYLKICVTISYMARKVFPCSAILQLLDAFFPHPVDSSELHVSGNIFCVFGKTCVAPMKPLSIPKLVLQASLLAAHLKDDILQTLAITIDRVFLSTNSTAVIQWLHSSGKQPTFVANRVSENLQLTTVNQLNHVCSIDNPQTPVIGD